MSRRYGDVPGGPDHPRALLGFVDIAPFAAIKLNQHCCKLREAAHYR
jgi:hypothetical protein